ncbi:adenosine deaminase AGSA-like [Uranotaenia lowii]|uniref:adenosine deaminase AGSA-like n=1 Tax=Uranotaenia lowii TaxID=190385 RepID=UPI00247AEE98|nr:adenosine deaminase AGSA-like [Uranotaenia lowii]
MSRLSYEAFLAQRKEIIQQEESRALGADIVLTEDETKVNEFVMKLKKAELEEGFNAPVEFAPSRHFFQVLDKISQSPLYQLLRKMPKGGILHTHDTAMGNTDAIIQATHREHLWQSGDFGGSNPIHYRFSKTKPAPIDGAGEWHLVSDIRKELGSEKYDLNVKNLLSLFHQDPHHAYHCVNHVWSKFAQIFITLEPLVTYKPVWDEYYLHALEQTYADNVCYVEFRGLLPPVYDLEGKIYTSEEIVQNYIDLTEQFQQAHPDFVGVKFIYAPLRIVDDNTYAQYFDTAEKLHKRFPTFMAGFDLVGQEDLGRPFTDVNDRLLNMSPTIQFFFHAGETNWCGLSDDNLIDAILLGTKRIGHGFAAVKHPRVLEEIKKRNICIELNPISNQVLKLVDDMRNHVGAILFSDNYPVVVSSDDPAFWCASPLSHDFYVAFLGLASARQDLRLLKKLALNSIEYSAMSPAEKDEAKQKWTVAWNKFIAETLKSIS